MLDVTNLVPGHLEARQRCYWVVSRGWHYLILLVDLRSKEAGKLGVRWPESRWKYIKI